jgi:hypothetical protein
LEHLVRDGVEAIAAAAYSAFEKMSDDTSDAVQTEVAACATRIAQIKSRFAGPAADLAERLNGLAKLT